MAANGEDRQAAAAAAAEEEIVLEMPVKPAPPPPLTSPPVKVSPAWETAALPSSMVAVQVFTVVMLFLSKLALNTGMRPCVLIVYRNLVAAAAVAPLAFFFERCVRTAHHMYHLVLLPAAKVTPPHSLSLSFGFVCANDFVFVRQVINSCHAFACVLLSVPSAQLLDHFLIRYFKYLARCMCTGIYNSNI